MTTLQTLTKRLNQPVRARIKQISTSEMTPPEQISELVKEALVFCEANKDALQDAGGATFQAVQWDKHPCFIQEVVASVIKKGVDRGDFRSTQPTKAANQILSSLTGEIGKKLTRREQLDIDRDRRDIENRLLNGMLIRNGD